MFRPRADGAQPTDGAAARLALQARRSAGRFRGHHRGPARRTTRGRISGRRTARRAAITVGRQANDTGPPEGVVAAALAHRP